MRTLLLLAWAVVAQAALRPEAPADCPMCDYVYTDDGAFAYEEYRDPYPRTGYTSYYIRLTSQIWLDESFSDWPEWWHYVVLNVPDENLYPEDAYLYISYMSNPDTPPGPTGGGYREEHQYTGQYTGRAGIVTAVIEQIPNQPITMTDDPENKGRYEDDLIVYLWKLFLDTEEAAPGTADPRWIVRMPMVKAAIKCMDLITLFVNDLNSDINISKFMLAGESKRGTVTWMAGAIDDRVIAMAPVVLSGINYHPSYHHYPTSFGGWPDWWWDYWVEGIMGWVDEPAAVELGKIDDSHTYRWGWVIPIMKMMGSTDEFFAIDDTQYFLGDIPEDNRYLRIVENAGHCITCSGGHAQDFWNMMENFHLAVINADNPDYALPSITWTLEPEVVKSPGGPVCTSADWGQGTGSITVHTDATPSSIEVWSSLSNAADRRDYRTWTASGPGRVTFVSGPVEDLGGGSYSATFDVPDEGEGFLAFFIKLVIPGPEGREYIFSTEAQLLPNCFPYPDCEGRECNGELV